MRERSGWGDPVSGAASSGDPGMVAEAIAAALAEGGGKHLFGVPGGGPNLDLIGASQAAGIRFVLTHGETSGAIMAGVAGELTGVPAGCLATRGPGAASMANGVAQAWLDRSPVLAVTDAVAAADRARIGHQRIDQQALMRASAKASLTVSSADAASTCKAAIGHALEPPWGPVHLDVVPDARPGSPALPRPAPGTGAEDLRRVRKAVGRARRPLLVAGVGSRFAEHALRAVATATGVPVLTTYKAKGAVPESSEQAAGLFTGAAIEAPVLERADLILMIGVDPVELLPVPWTYAASVIAIGPWPTPDPYFPLADELIGPIEDLLPELAPELDGQQWDVSGASFRGQALGRLEVGGDGLTPHSVIREARRQFPDPTVATVDSGAHMLVAMPLWKVEAPRLTLISSGLATMGFALPAAIAAGLVMPERPVICFTGDGGLGMCLAELETLARLDLAITIVVLNDSLLSLIRIKQRAERQGGPDAVRYGPSDFAQIARGFGISSTRVESGSGLSDALARASGSTGPMLIDVVVDPSGYRHVLDVIRGA